MIRPSQFEVTSTADGPVRTLSVTGELDMITVTQLAEHVASADGAQSSLTLDLRGLTFMDSSGLRFLIELNDRAKQDGWQLALIAPTEEAATMVHQVTGADKALPFKPAGKS